MRTLIPVAVLLMAEPAVALVAQGNSQADASANGNSADGSGGGNEAPLDLFAAMDTDSDQKISLIEMEVYFRANGAEVPENLFQSEDKDKNGFISYVWFVCVLEGRVYVMVCGFNSG